MFAGGDVTTVVRRVLDGVGLGGVVHVSGMVAAEGDDRAAVDDLGETVHFQEFLNAGGQIRQGIDGDAHVDALVIAPDDLAFGNGFVGEAAQTVDRAGLE